jgi:hypothetical protein
MDSASRKSPGCKHREINHGPEYWKKSYEKYGCDGIIAAIQHDIDDTRNSTCLPTHSQKELIDAIFFLIKKCPTKNLLE